MNNEIRPGETGDKNLLRDWHRSFSIIGFGLLAAFALNIGLQNLGFWLITSYLPDFVASVWAEPCLHVVVQYLIALPAGMLILRAVGSDTPVSGGYSPRAGELILIFICCYPLMYLGNWIGQFFNSLIYAFSGRSSYSGISQIASDWPLWLFFLVVVVAGPIMEELFFRGAVLKALRPWGARAAVFGSAAAFGLFHGNLEQFFYAFFLGIVFGELYERTGKLRNTILLHMGINLLSGFLPAALIRLFVDQGQLESFAEQYSAAPIKEPEQILEILSEYSGLLSGLVYLAMYAAAVIGLSLAGAILAVTFRGRLTPLPRDGRKIPSEEIGSVVFLAPGIVLFILAAVAWIVVGVFLTA